MLGKITGIASAIITFKWVKWIWKARKILGKMDEIKKAMKEGGEFITALKNTRALAEKVWRDKKVDTDEAKQLAEQTRAVTKEAEDFYIAVMKVLD